LNGPRKKLETLEGVDHMLFHDQVSMKQVSDKVLKFFE